MQKERRHEYETVWVDSEGNELDEPPDELVATSEKRSNGSKQPKAKAQQRGGRPVRIPPKPSWRRAVKRASIFGGAIFALFLILGSKSGHHNITSALALGAVYTLLFIPFTFYIDRFAYNRWERRTGQQRDPKKR
jgi:hypothetical protein